METTQMETTQPAKAPKKRTIGIIALLLALVLAAALVLVVIPSVKARKSAPKIVSQATLEKIINVSDLSTFQATYNGVAKVSNPDNPQKIDYYVSYKAHANAGIDLSQVQIQVDDQQKIISVKLPDIKITDVSVDIGSLDYIFLNMHRNTSTVSVEAYQFCINDVTEKSSSQPEIYQLAKQNAENFVEALIRPFIADFGPDYQLQID